MIYAFYVSYAGKNSVALLFKIHHYPDEWLAKLWGAADDRFDELQRQTLAGRLFSGSSLKINFFQSAAWSQ